MGFLIVPLRHGLVSALLLQSNQSMIWKSAELSSIVLIECGDGSMGSRKVNIVVPCRKARKGKDRGKDDVDGPK